MTQANHDEGLSAPEDAKSESGTFGARLRQGLGNAQERVVGTADTITGVEFRRQFEDFTDAVTTTVIGVHREQGALRERLEDLEASIKSDDTSQQLAELKERQDKLETSSKSRGLSPFVVAFGILSILALALSIIAAIRTF